jgi:hypothetical protein
MLDILRSKYLAISLMVSILLVVLFSTVFLSPLAAHRLVFTTLWFNGILLLLVVNTACCFFSRLSRRSWDLAFSGIVIFHLSFVMLFLGVAYDKLCYFHGTVRLTEGETLNLADRASYDDPEWGRLFAPARTLMGEVTLHKILHHYNVSGRDKGVAAELTFSSGAADTVRGFTYVTNHLTYNGFRFFRDKGGFSPCVLLYEKDGKESYGACYSLQSLREKDGKFSYTTGSPHGPSPIPFPQAPLKPLFNLLTRYYPEPKNELGGKIQFGIAPLPDGQRPGKEEILFGKKAIIGEKVLVGEHLLELKEVRSWVNLDVKYNPGRYLIMISFWSGLGGITLTLLARIFRQGKRKSTTGKADAV